MSCDSHSPSTHLPKIKDSKKEVLYKLTLLLIFFTFSTHAQADGNELMVHQVSQKTEKQTEVSEFVLSSSGSQRRHFIVHFWKRKLSVLIYNVHCGPITFAINHLVMGSSMSQA